MHDDISERVFDLRTTLGLSVTEFAAQAGLPTSTVSRLELQQNKAESYHVRICLARATGVSVEVLSEYLEGRLMLHEMMRIREIMSPDHVRQHIDRLLSYAGRKQSGTMVASGRKSAPPLAYVRGGRGRY